MLENLELGFDVLFSVGPLVWLVVGLIIGFVVGVLPGLSTSNAAALILPFSIGMPLESALILIVSVYAGVNFAGAIPAILINVPGEAGSAVTALDGYPMAQQGRASYAIGLARTSSALGGMLSAVAVILVLQPLGQLALTFGAREMLVVVLLGLAVASMVIGPSVRKGILAGLLGLLLGTMGASPIGSTNRFSFDEPSLYDGVPFVPALIGMFALSEMFVIVSKRRAAAQTNLPQQQSLWREMVEAVKGIPETLKRPVQVFRAASIGTVLGVIPGIGTSVSNFFAYGVAKRQSKTPDQFGKGSSEGIIASESSDNATSTATLVPTMTLGVPGSATMAVILAAFYLQGIQPGPRLLQTNPGEIYAALLAMFVVSILIIPLGILLAGPLAQITRIPQSYLVPAVIFLALAGSFAARYSLFDVGLALAFGILGWLMRMHGYPVIPVILGLILGPLAEANFLRAWALADGNVMYFFGSATVLALWSMLILSILYVVWSGRKERKSKIGSA